jgi:hypothetical protein
MFDIIVSQTLCFLKFLFGRGQGLQPLATPLDAPLQAGNVWFD